MNARGVEVSASSDLLALATCHQCGSLSGVRALSTGWIFRCETCGVEYGHSQLHDRVAAHGALYDYRHRNRTDEVSS